jgi:hypothetical protein
MPTDPASPNSTGRMTITVYDSAGRPVRTIDPPGLVTTTAYSGCSPADSVPSGKVTWIRFDAEGNVIDRGTGWAPGSEMDGTDPDGASPDEPHIVE